MGFSKVFNVIGVKHEVNYEHETKSKWTISIVFDTMDANSITNAFVIVRIRIPRQSIGVFHALGLSVYRPSSTN